VAAHEIKIVLVVEADAAYGERIQHVFPSHQAHDAAVACACQPILLVHHAVHGCTEETITVYWHNWGVGHARV